MGENESGSILVAYWSDLAAHLGVSMVQADREGLGCVGLIGRGLGALAVALAGWAGCGWRLPTRAHITININTRQIHSTLPLNQSIIYSTTT